jgi:hypothetical protein
MDIYFLSESSLIVSGGPYVQWECRNSDRTALPAPVHLPPSPPFPIPYPNYAFHYSHSYIYMPPVNSFHSILVSPPTLFYQPRIYPGLLNLLCDLYSNTTQICGKTVFMST